MQVAVRWKIEVKDTAVMTEPHCTRFVDKHSSVTVPVLDVFQRNDTKHTAAHSVEVFLVVEIQTVTVCCTTNTEAGTAPQMNQPFSKVQFVTPDVVVDVLAENVGRVSDKESCSASHKTHMFTDN